jgi:Undecaprenyl-phosphate glucose phosphotransferase
MTQLSFYVAGNKEVSLVTACERVFHSHGDVMLLWEYRYYFVDSLPATPHRCGNGNASEICAQTQLGERVSESLMMTRHTSCAAGHDLGGLTLLHTSTRSRTRLPIGAITAATQLMDFGLFTLTGIVTTTLGHADPMRVGNGLLQALLPAVIGWTVVQRLGGYALAGLSVRSGHVRAITTSALAGALCFAACSVLQDPSASASLPLTLMWFALAGILLTAQRLLGAPILARWCANGRISRRVAVIGKPEDCASAMSSFSKGPGAAVEVVSMYTYRTGEHYASSGLAAWERRLQNDAVQGSKPMLDAVVIAMPDVEPAQMEAICGRLAGLAADIYVSIPPHIAECRSIDRLGSLPAGLAVGRPLSAWQMLQKDIFDRLGALLILFLTWPVFVVVALLVRLDSRGPALFRQQRIGYNNRPFTCFKFRTMYHNPMDVPVLQQAVRGDKRVTRIGRWLRKTSIDELPQLLNVLLGDMSLVGPRPHAPNTTAGGKLFTDIVRGYEHRHRVKPGITGWAQVNGSRGETPDPKAVERRVELDMFYIRNWSLLLDMNILLRTLFCVIHDPLAF